MTQKELQALAVRALGEGATVSMFRDREQYELRATRVGTDEVAIWHSKKSTATRALAAALRALAEVKRD